MKTSEQVNEIAEALNKAQSIMTGAKKGSLNPFFKSNYSDLTSVMQAISLPFSENGLSFVQGAEFNDGMICVATRIMHSSGQWIEASTQVPTVKNDPQAYGSAVTYAKRYGLQALAGVPSVDDDGQYASAAIQEQTLQDNEQAKIAEKEAQENRIKEACKRHDNSIAAIIEAIANNNLSEVYECWNEIPTADKSILWVAPSKFPGVAPFTTAEREAIKNSRSAYAEANAA